MPTALIGHREQVRANVKQQEKAAALTGGGPSLGDWACEDPPSASIIVVISSSQAECLDLPCLPLCLQPVEATVKGHWGPATRLGASCSSLSLTHSFTLSLPLSTATQLFVHLKPPDTRGPFIPPLSCTIQMFILTCGRGRSRVGRPRRCTGVISHLFDQLFQKAVAIIHCQSTSASEHIGKRSNKEPGFSRPCERLCKCLLCEYWILFFNPLSYTLSTLLPFGYISPSLPSLWHPVVIKRPPPSATAPSPDHLLVRPTALPPPPQPQTHTGDPESAG